MAMPAAVGRLWRVCRTRRRVLTAIAAILAAAAPMFSASADTPLFESCRLRGIDDAARCAMFTLPETPQGTATVRIHVAIVPALTRNPEPDPVYVLAGGPGQAASDIGGLVEALSALRRRRDIVLVDQRGTGRSKTLTCKSDGNDTGTMDPVSAAFVAPEGSERRAWARCLETMKGNVAAHRTDDYIDDLEAISSALNHKRINLWGGSYGSRVALRYMKRFPARIRSAVLDGVAPTSMHLPDDALGSSAARLDALFTACAASPGCAKAYPNAAKAFDTTLSRLRQQPLRVSLLHPASGTRITGTLSDRRLLMLTWPLLYKAESSRLLPALLDAAARGDAAPLLSTVAASSVTEGDIAVPMRFAVMCAEDMLDRKPPTHTPFASIAELFYGFCTDLPHGRVAAEFFEPTVSAIPTLLLSGRVDPVTPPRYAELAAKTLTNHRLLTVANAGHIVSTLPCVRRIITRFVESAEVGAARHDCERNLQLPPPLFYVSPLVAAP
ncbi:MAG: alpha/beta fold hydrolase [Proteobacteria bacterium]|nr:alpha/beta fold hydrolase [Pseudomonadota bacterium]